MNIERRRNPADGSFERAFGMPDFRSHMSASADGVLSAYPLPRAATQETLDRAMLHEAGHLLDFDLREDGDAAAADWDRAMASDGRSPSAYARKSRGEDFAETTALYLRVIGTPEEASVRRLFPERFRVLDEALLNRSKARPE